MSEREEQVAAATLLRDATEAQIRDLEPRFAGFTEAVLSHLDDDVRAEPERVLRADEATPEELADAPWIDDATLEVFGPALREAFAEEAEAQDWAAFAAGVEDAIDGEALAPAVGAALREQTSAAVEAADWAAFAAGVEDAIDGEALAPAVAAALSEEAAEAVAAREGQWDAFTDAVMAKLPAESVTVAELLTEATEAELASRDGEWTAFTARVFDAVDAEARAAARAPLAEQAVLAMRAEVESEVEAMAPAFGESFKRDVEKQIFKSAQRPDPWWTRAAAWVREMFSFDGGYGLAAAAATAMVLVVVTGLPPSETPDVGRASVALGGQVAVEQLSFEGDVTVMPEDGITIVWLDDVAS